MEYDVISSVNVSVRDVGILHEPWQPFKHPHLHTVHTSNGTQTPPARYSETSLMHSPSQRHQAVEPHQQSLAHGTDAS